MNHWKLIDYTDVWNSPEGWQVNNLCVVTDDIYMAQDVTDKEILDFLVHINYLVSSDMRKLYLDNMGDMIEIYQKKGNYPLGRLELVA